MMSLSEQLKMLHGDGYFDSENTLRDLTNGKAEFEYMKRFIEENDFDGETLCDQLRSLWTAYCIHHGLECDTGKYDGDLLDLWNVMDEQDNIFWSCFDSFDNFMCKYLV